MTQREIQWLLYSAGKMILNLARSKSQFWEDRVRPAPFRPRKRQVVFGMMGDYVVVTEPPEPSPFVALEYLGRNLRDRYDRARRTPYERCADELTTLVMLQEDSSDNTGDYFLGSPEPFYRLAQEWRDRK